jgi:hypothetical protein
MKLISLPKIRERAREREREIERIQFLLLSDTRDINGID